MTGPSSSLSGDHPGSSVIESCEQQPPVVALLSREEIRFQHLLVRTQEHCSEVAASGRLPPKVQAFVQQLKQMLKELETHSQ